MGDEEGEAGSVGDKVLQGGQGNGQAIMGGSAPPQLIHNHQRACSCTGKDVACLTQLLHHHHQLLKQQPQTASREVMPCDTLAWQQRMYHAGQGICTHVMQL